MTDKLSGKIMTDIAVLKPKRYSYLIHDNDKNQKWKDKKVVSSNENLNLKIINFF